MAVAAERRPDAGGDFGEGGGDLAGFGDLIPERPLGAVEDGFGDAGGMAVTGEGDVGIGAAAGKDGPAEQGADLGGRRHAADGGDDPLPASVEVAGDAAARTEGERGGGW